MVCTFVHYSAEKQGVHMIVLGREVYVCKCNTEVASHAAGDEGEVRWSLGTPSDLGLVPREHHGDDHLTDFRARFARGEQWLIGVVEGRIVSYTWLHARTQITYPYIPGCTFKLGQGVGYGYDAWTSPDLRGHGLRRRGFVEELHVLRASFGCEWEASFFVSHQLEGATRSLATVGIQVVPLWRVRLVGGRKTIFEPLAPGDASAEPIECG